MTLRTCKKCGEYYKANGKFSKVCWGCKKEYYKKRNEKENTKM